MRRSLILFFAPVTTDNVTTFEIVDAYIQSVYTIRNPEKLQRIHETLNR